MDGLTGGKKRDKALERTEFLQCLVRVAVLRYVQPKLCLDVSEAYERLLVECIEPKLDTTILSHPNDFRALCYQQPVDATLRHHEPSLRAIFGALARVGKSPSVKPLGALMRLTEWRTLCKRLMLIDADLPERHCILCFVLSRMAVVDGQSERGKLKEAAIPFEGFLECLCRIACLKALPTSEELQAVSTPEAPCVDAGHFYLNLRGGDPKIMTAFVDENAVAWGDEPRQPLHECLDGILTLIIRTIEGQVSAAKGGKGFADNLQVTHEEMLSWIDLVGWEHKEEKMNTSLG